MLTILTGDVIEQLRTLPDESVHCCVTSPPYWGLRDYSTNGQLGLEKTPEQYVAKMVEVFREVRRVLRKDGTCWVNMGDAYNSPNTHTGKADKVDWGLQRVLDAKANAWIGNKNLKPKDLLGMPWRVAFALQADGWWLRSDIIWAKPNPMPESVTDRPTKAHEYLFLLTKSANYFYDAEAIREKQGNEMSWEEWNRNRKEWQPRDVNENGVQLKHAGQNKSDGGHSHPNGRNKRSVWTVATAPYPEAHFATYPPDLIKPCILAGTSAKGCCAKCGSPWERIVEDSEQYAAFKKSENDRKGRGMRSSDLETMGLTRGTSNQSISAEKKTIGWQPTCACSSTDLLGNQFCKPIAPCTVLDPFAGSGTTGTVALELGRKAVLIELNPKYVELIERRCSVTMGLPLAV